MRPRPQFPLLGGQQRSHWFWGLLQALLPSPGGGGDIEFISLLLLDLSGSKAESGLGEVQTFQKSNGEHAQENSTAVISDS